MQWLDDTIDAMHDNSRNENQAGAPSPNQGFGKPLTPQVSNRPLGRVLILAFLPCFLWPPLTILLQKLLAFSNGAVSQIQLLSVIIASVILYPRCFIKRRRLFRVFMALLVGWALLCCAWVLWVVFFLILLKLTGGGAPFPT
jgi:hypothetical protein